MGLMRFLVHEQHRMTQERAARAYIAGHDRVPWPSRSYWTGELLVIERPADDSGNFHVPWDVDGYGELILGTATLREREKPYNLQVELARGKLNQVRNQIAEWQSIGLAVPDRLGQKVKEATELFAKAATNQHNLEECADHSNKSLIASLEAAHLLTSCYADQALAARHRQDPKLNTLLGANLGRQLLNDFTARQFLTTFNTSIIPFNWRDIEAREGSYDWSISDAQIEWCLANRLVTYGGPLLYLDRSGMPDWLYLWEGDFPTMMSFVSDYVETVVARYQGKVQLWECAAGANVGSPLALTEEQRLRLTVRAIETTRQVDPEAQCLIRIDQPWAEYMTLGEWDLSPIHFADALARADLGLAGVNLEINIGYQPGGSPLRDPLEFSRLLDLWSYLGLPLYVTLTFPTSDGEDPKAQRAAIAAPGAMSGGWNAAAQRSWVEKMLPLILAKRSVYGIFWNQLSDSDPHLFAYGGLFSNEGRPKPALATLAAMRQYHLR